MNAGTVPINSQGRLLVPDWVASIFRRGLQFSHLGKVGDGDVAFGKLCDNLSRPTTASV